MDASYGWLDQFDPDSDANLLDFTIGQQLARRLNICKLVQIQAVNGSGLNPVGTVDALPLVSPVNSQGNPVSPHRTVYNLPYFRLQGGTNAVICDPSVGDVGFVVCADRDSSSLVKNQLSNSGTNPQKTYAPGSWRMFDLADGIYIGGILNGKPKQYFQFTSDGIMIVDTNGNKIVTGPTGTTISDLNGNEMIMSVGQVNFLTPVLKINGIPVTVP